MTYTATDFANWYTSYDRDFYTGNFRMYQQRIAALELNTPFTRGSSVLVVGCGLGFLMEYLLDLGAAVNKVWGLDFAPHMQSRKLLDGDSRIQSHILDFDVRTTSSNILRQYLGGNGKSNWVITEDVLPLYTTSSDVQTILSACEGLQGGHGGVAHIVSTYLPENNQDASMWWRTLDAWATENPAHYWIDVHGQRVMGGA